MKRSHINESDNLSAVLGIFNDEKSMEKIQMLADRWADEYMYEDINDYIDVIADSIFKGIDCQIYPAQKCISCVKIPRSSLAFVISGVAADKVILVVVGDRGSSARYVKFANDKKLAAILGGGSVEQTPIVPELKGEYKKNKGQVVNLNGDEYEVGGIVLKYNTDFEGGYLTIGQIVSYDSEKGEIVVRIPDNDILSVNEWNAAVASNETFLLLDHTARTVDETADPAEPGKELPDHYYAYTPERMEAFAAKVKKSQADYPYRRY